MTPTLRKRLLIGASGIVGLLIVALLAAPALIDVNSYKPEIIAQVKKATGRDLVLDGPISLSLLPMPTVTIDGVKFFNVQGSKNPNMVEVKSVTVKPALGALLTGSLEVSEVTLVEPKIVLEINAEGKPNWEFTPSVAEAKPVAPKPSSAKPLSLGRLTIENGTLIFSDSKAGLSVVAEKANFSASVSSLDGPYSLAGGAIINGAPLRLRPFGRRQGAVGPHRRGGAGGGRRQTLLQGHAERARAECQAFRHGLELGRQSDRLCRNPDQDQRPARARLAGPARRQVQLRRRRRRLANRHRGHGLQAGAGPGQHVGFAGAHLEACARGRRQACGKQARSRPVAGGDRTARPAAGASGRSTRRIDGLARAASRPQHAGDHHRQADVRRGRS